MRYPSANSRRECRINRAMNRSARARALRRFCDSPRAPSVVARHGRNRSNFRKIAMLRHTAYNGKRSRLTMTMRGRCARYADDGGGHSSSSSSSSSPPPRPAPLHICARSAALNRPPLLPRAPSAEENEKRERRKTERAIETLPCAGYPVRRRNGAAPLPPAT